MPKDLPPSNFPQSDHLAEEKTLQKMPGDPEVDNLDTELTRLEVGVRQMVQDFPLCATFREIDQQNSLVRGEMDNMREKLLLLDNLALEQVHIKFSSLLRV